MSGSALNAAQVAEKVAKYIKLCWPQDREAIFENLTLVEEQIWKSGKFHNSTAWFYVGVNSDGTLITPHGYNVLLGIDLNGKPAKIRDKQFLFHANGPGDVMLEGVCKKLYSDVYDLGESPVMFQPTDIEYCGCNRCNFSSPKNIQVITPAANYISNEQFTIVSGLNYKGNDIYTYEKEDENGVVESCLCSQEDSEDFKVIQGVKYPISWKGFARCNVPFSRINNIIKSPTPVPVEYYVVGSNGCKKLIARLEPSQIVSRYRRYQLDTRCRGKTCVLALFKRSEPDPIQFDNQLFISRNRQAIISMAMAMDYKYNQSDPSRAVPYLSDAMAQLNAELKENRSNSLTSIQVDNQSGWGNFPKM